MVQGLFFFAHLFSVCHAVRCSVLQSVTRLRPTVPGRPASGPQRQAALAGGTSEVEQGVERRAVAGFGLQRSMEPQVMLQAMVQVRDTRGLCQHANVIKTRQQLLVLMQLGVQRGGSTWANKAGIRGSPCSPPPAGQYGESNRRLTTHNRTRVHTTDGRKGELQMHPGHRARTQAWPRG